MKLATYNLNGIRARLPRLLEWLDRETLAIDGVRFIGTTLWSDFDALALREQDLTKQLQRREKAFRAANYYLSKNTTLKNGEKVLAEGIRAMSLDCQEWLRGALGAPFAGRTVVVTHFAPSLQSADPRYGLTPGTAGFCNAMDALFPADSDRRPRVPPRSRR